MEKSEASKIVSLLFASFPSSHLERRHVDAYVAGIVDLPADAAGAACRRLVGTCRFLPSVAEIRSAVADVTLGPRRTGEQAYDILMQAVRRFGWPCAPRFRDEHITRAIGVWGSWQDLCASPSDDPGGRARFIALYEDLASAERADIVSGKPLPKPRAGQREFGLLR